MKKNLYTIAVVIGIIAIVVALWPKGIQTNESWVGETYYIDWEMVNVREEYNTCSKILTSLYYGEEVILTGRYIELAPEDNDTANWVEVQLKDGATGWMVLSALGQKMIP